MATTLKSAREWLNDPEVIKENGGKEIILVSEHGWHHDGVDMDAPITLDDFWQRLNRCTVMVPKSALADIRRQR